MTDSAVLAGSNNDTCGEDSGIGTGYSNVNIGYASFIAAGASNTINEFASGFIGSGDDNFISGEGGEGNPYPFSFDSAIVGGNDNLVNAPQSMIGAGFNNSIYPGGAPGNISPGPSSFIGAGERNAIASNYSVIVGGYKNSTGGEYTSILGGFNNVASGPVGVVGGTIGGGYGNTASGQNSTIPGGASNVASGMDSFAAGLNSHAVNPGTFVWSDEASGATTLSSTASNQFLARASGGFYLFSSASLRTGVRLAPGSGSWSNLSDRNVKNNVQAIDPAQILARFDAMPVSEWSYDSEGSVRHLGPMAQDFRAAFGLGEDDKTISTVDEEGVALAAIKALKADVAEKDAQIAELRRAQSDADRRLEAKCARLEQRLDALEARGKT